MLYHSPVQENPLGEYICSEALERSIKPTKDMNQHSNSVRLAHTAMLCYEPHLSSTLYTVRPI